MKNKMFSTFFLYYHHHHLWRFFPRSSYTGDKNITNHRTNVRNTYATIPVVQTMTCALCVLAHRKVFKVNMKAKICLPFKPSIPVFDM